MILDLVDYEHKSHEAIRAFYKSSEVAGKGKHAAFAAGKSMDGFVALVQDIVLANGLGSADIHQKNTGGTLPAYVRSTNLWDVVVISKGELVAAIKLKSQIGASVGNDFDDSATSAIVDAYDLRRAHASGAFRNQMPPFMGLLMLVEDGPRSRAPVKDNSPHFPIFKEFDDASYLNRYDILCQRLVQERLYTTAALIASPRTAAKTGEYAELSRMTGLRTFIASLAGHIAAQAARLG